MLSTSRPHHNSDDTLCWFNGNWFVAYLFSSWYIYFFDLFNRRCFLYLHIHTRVETDSILHHKISMFKCPLFQQVPNTPSIFHSSIKSSALMNVAWNPFPKSWCWKVWIHPISQGNRSNTVIQYIIYSCVPDKKYTDFFWWHWHPAKRMASI